MKYVKFKEILFLIFILVIIITILYIEQSLKIVLNGEKIITLGLNDNYKELGYKVYKNNLEIIKKVKIVNNVNTSKIGVYKVIYILDNRIIITRFVRIIDKEPPKITLKGSKEVNVTLGNTYEEEGYSAFDNYDGDITYKVKVTTNFDKKIGKYYKKYEVSDSSGNKISITRTINVIENNNGIIYLTFDDGPSYLTLKVLDILKEEDIKATFFLINFSNDKENIVKRIYDEGHTIGLHSYTHVYSSIYSSVDNYFNDLYKLQNKVKDVTGIESKIIRFPGGSSNTVSRFNKGIMTKLKSEVLDKGFHYFDWNVGSNDVGNARNSNEVYNNVIYNLSKNRSNVVLMHDTLYNSKILEAIPNIIKTAKSNGYIFSNITYHTPMVMHRINN